MEKRNHLRLNLLEHFTGANLGGVADPKNFVAQFREQAFEPANRPVASIPTRTGPCKFR